jgi:putative ABC transport system substrate-binding protein
MRRRDFIKFVAGSAAAWPLLAHAEQQTMSVIGLLDLRSADTVGDRLPAFRRGLKESGYVEGEMLRLSIAGPRMKSAGCLSWPPTWLGARSM